MSIISVANAQGAATAGQGGFGSLIMMAVLIAVFYFLLIRPQQQRMKQHQAMIANLKEGDEVVTGGGFLGKVVKLHDNIAEVTLAEGVTVKVQKPTITTVVPNGSFEKAA